MFTYISKRFKHIRTEIFNVSQKDFAAIINNDILKHHPDDFNELNFSQNTISSLELNLLIKRSKLIYLFNFLYLTKRINPLWLIMKNNKKIPMYLIKIEIDSTINEKQENIKKYLSNIYEQIEGIDQIIKNKNL